MAQVRNSTWNGMNQEGSQAFGPGISGAEFTTDLGYRDGQNIQSEACTFLIIAEHMLDVAVQLWKTSPTWRLIKGWH